MRCVVKRVSILSAGWLTRLKSVAKVRKIYHLAFTIHHLFTLEICFFSFSFSFSLKKRNFAAECSENEKVHFSLFHFNF